jgi:hypothetical protein
VKIAERCDANRLSLRCHNRCLAVRLSVPRHGRHLILQTRCLHNPARTAVLRSRSVERFRFATYTLIHVVISLIAVVAGFVVLAGLLKNRRLDAWTAVSAFISMSLL